MRRRSRRRIPSRFELRTQPTGRMDSANLKQIQVGGGKRQLEVELRRGASLRTASGSVYRVVQDAERRWWLNADNVPNPASRKLDPQFWWRIQQPNPWPPELGSPVMLLAPLDFDRCDPERLPGGGRFTSPVRLIQHLG